MKRIIIILAILIGISIPALIVYKTLTWPSKLKLILPKDTDSKVNMSKSIVIRIDENENFFINDKRTQLAMITKQIDSLGLLGLNDSTIILDADKRVMIATIVQIMNLAKDTDRKLIIKTTPTDE